MPYARRNCNLCGNLFQPPHPSRNKSKSYADLMSRCSDCRGIETTTIQAAKFVFHDEDPPPAVEEAPRPPLVQGIFDLETFTLDRNWGVLLVGSIMIHRGGTPETHTFTLRETAPNWPRERGNDAELARQVAAKLDECHILYAHNGSRFDVPWMRTLALKHGFPWHEKKLVDPCAVAWKRYKLSNNSLQTVANFLGLGQKMPLGEHVWRDAILNDDDAAWELLKERCESDVTILNRIAAAVVGSVGTIDTGGSAYR